MFNGLIASSLLINAASGLNAPALDSREQHNATSINVWEPDVSHIVQDSFEQINPTIPVENLTGNESQHFVGDYYYRLHVSINSIDVGNLISTQTHNVEIWNSFFQSNTLQGVNESGLGGITLTGPGLNSLPDSYFALEEKTYTIQVTSDGAASINGSIEFDFSLSAIDPIITITGQRILVFWPAPDWSAPVIDTYTFATDVIESRNGKEQRIKLREYPKRTIGYSSLIKGNELRVPFENLLYAWQARSSGVPVWRDHEFITAPLIIGQSVIPVDTTNRDYHVDGLAVIIKDARTFVSKITAVTPASIELVNPIDSNWDTNGVRVAPMRVCRMVDSLTVKRETDDLITMNPLFELSEVERTGSIAEPATYLNYSVLDQQTNWAENFETEYARKQVVQDFVTGPTMSSDLTGFPVMTVDYSWLVGTRNEAEIMRQFLFSRYGKLVPFWYPTFMNDMMLVANVSSSTGSIDIKHINYTKNIQASVNRRNIRVEMYNGDILYRRIGSSTELDATTERINLTTTFDAAFDIEDVKIISFMNLYRLDQDSFELEWITKEVARCGVRLRTIRDDF